MTPTLGLSIIARDEAANLPHLLASVAGAFDQVALLDTGSQDRTVEVFETWADAQDLPLGHRVGAFEWRDDFAAARNAADGLLETDWLCWANADDEVRGAANLRAIAATAPPEVAAVSFPWDYVDGGPLSRERLIRRGRGRWRGRVHEALLVDGVVASAPTVVALWHHRRRDDWAGTDARNLAIARRWVEDEPDDPRALALASIEEFDHGDWRRAVATLRRYTGLPVVRRRLGDDWLARATVAVDRLAEAPIPEDRWQECFALAQDALGCLPNEWLAA
jgi:glycosyltransferase involved in cell wall biosynthesis